MKKGMRIFILFLLSLCIYGQTLQTMPVYAATGKKIVATKKASISKRKKTLKKKNKISVIVHSTSKAGVSTTKKVTVKKETMKKAATKTASTTKKTTSKKKSTKKTGSVTVTTETTVVTTVKTSTKKKSKIKTIETTIVTTVKTTRITTSSPATGTGTTGGSGFSISKFTDVKGHINPKLYNAFITLGFQFKINPSLSTTGVFSVQQHNIQLKTGRSSYLYHELGHFLSILKGRGGKYVDKSSEFISIFNAEKSAYRGNNKAYVTQDTSEYFAESFCDYTENPSALKQQRPKTYNYINNMVNSISDNDITAFRNTYEWIWNLK